MRTTLWEFLCDESGSVAIEYGLMSAGMTLVTVAAVQKLGNDVRLLFTNVGDVIAASTP
jgi:Flp pilus assembly pilin Flp